jgi:hypothetical protein
MPGKAAGDDKSADCEKEKNGEIWRHIKPQEIAEKNLADVPEKSMDAKTPRAASVPSQSLGRNIELRLSDSNT